jgi:hypothetical protein
MSASTGPLMAAGGIVVFNATIVQGKAPITQTRVIVGTLIAAAGFSLAERAAPRAAVALAWLVLAGVLLVRVDPNTPAPLESFNQWYNGK